jgi:hypothetical protein
MGRQYCGKKSTVQECRSVSIAFLRKHGYFCGLCSGVISWTNCLGERTASISVTVCTMHGENYARFQYTSTRRSTQEKTECDDEVPLVSTPCHFGGVRWWFICPLTTNGAPCGRRVAKLYCPPGAKHYGCRHCHNLSYDSRNEYRRGRIGQLTCAMKLMKRRDRLRGQIKRWAYGGKPTRKARMLQAVEARLSAQHRIIWGDRPQT